MAKIPGTMHRRTILTLSVSGLLLASCSFGGSGTVSWSSNPLVASRYGDDLANAMANLIITNDPIAQDKAVRPIIDREIEEGKRITREAEATMKRSMQGGIIPINEDVRGYALYLDDRLYFSTDFESKPGPDLHVYLTQAVDPRDGEFPDGTAVDLGVLQSPYGAQEYRVPPQERADALRTVVFWDKSLRRLYGFGQLSKR